jgi:hypothetical protein
MKYEQIIKHILINPITYIEEYSKKENLTDKEKGILLGMWADVDSIRNQLITEELEIDIDLEKIMNDLQELINK